MSIRIRVNVEGHPPHFLEFPDFTAADVGERVKIATALACRCYNMLHFYRGPTVGLSGGGSHRNLTALIQLVINEFKRGNAAKVLQQVATGGGPVQVVEVPLGQRLAADASLWWKGVGRRLTSRPRLTGRGTYLGLDVGREGIKAWLQKDGKALYKGTFPGALDADGDPADVQDRQSLGRAIQSAAVKTIEIGVRPLGVEKLAVDQVVVVVSRAARNELLPEPRWVLEALHRKLECPVWLHADREAQALGCGAAVDRADVAAVSLGTTLSLGLLAGGLPVPLAAGVEWFWLDTTKDCMQGAAGSLLGVAAEIAACQRKGWRTAQGAPEPSDINGAVADKKHLRHFHAVEVVRDVARQTADLLAELHAFRPFGAAVLTGARTLQIGQLLADEVAGFLKRMEPKVEFPVLTAETSGSPALTGAWGAALLAAAHGRGLAVGGDLWTAFAEQSA